MFSFFKKKNKSRSIELYENDILMNGYVKDDDRYLKEYSDKSYLYLIQTQDEGIVLQWRTDYDSYEIPEQEHEAMYDKLNNVMEEYNFTGELVIVDFDAVEFFVSFDDLEDHSITIKTIADFFDAVANLLEQYLK